MRARGRRRAPTSVDEALDAVREQPSMTGAALVGPRLDDASRTSTTRPAPCASRSSTTARSARSCAGSRASGASVTVFPHDVDADTLAGFDGVLLSNGPGDPEPLDRRGRGRRATCSGACRCSGICLGHQLLALATGLAHLQAPVRPPRREPPGGRARRRGRVLVTSQNHGFAVEASADRARHARVALRRHRRGRRLPGAARALGAVPPRGRAGAARRLVDPRRVGRGGAPCRGVTTSHSICLIGSGPDRDRPGLRVRLRRLPGAEGAARGRLPRRSSSTRTRRRS